MKRRFYETDRMYRRRCDLNTALASTQDKKMWRVCAIEMLRQKDGGWKMGKQDHFTVEACTEEMAVGVFKVRNDMMSWFVTGVEPEIVSA